jgi:hypothetical protein
MENTASFDLTRAIQQWREQLGQAPALRRENLDELESHLADSIADLQSRGLSARESFMVATQRLGREEALQAEFRKVNSGKVWLDRMLWMLTGIQVWALVSNLVGSISTGAVSLGLIRGNFDFAGHGSTLPALLFAVARLLAVAGSLAICWWLVVRKGPALGSWIGRFLEGRTKLAVLCGMLFLVSAAGSLLSSGPSMLLTKLAGIQTYGSLMVSRSYADLFGWPVQTATLLALTLVVARKRLHPSDA